MPAAAGAAAADHSATAEVDAGAPPHTDYTARQRMEGVPANAFAAQSVVTRVVDHRRAWFVANVEVGLPGTITIRSIESFASSTSTITGTA